MRLKINRSIDVTVVSMKDSLIAMVRPAPGGGKSASIEDIQRRPRVMLFQERRGDSRPTYAASSGLC